MNLNKHKFDWKPASKHLKLWSRRIGGGEGGGGSAGTEVSLQHCEK